MTATGDPTFLFADLAGFTALTEAHGDDDAADVVARFFSEVEAVLPAYGAREVKRIGDAVMLIVPDAARAVSLGLRVAHEIGGCDGLPSVRVGMHSGSAVERQGDWFGAAVNLAARVSGLAGGDQVLLTEDTRALAEPLEGVELRSLGAMHLRNVGDPVRVHEAVSAAPGSDRLPIDPVCRMAVEPSHEAGRLLHSGTEYHFCSLECARAFTANPDAYAGRAERAGDAP